MSSICFGTASKFKEFEARIGDSYCGHLSAQSGDIVGDFCP